MYSKNAFCQKKNVKFVDLVQNVTNFENNSTFDDFVPYLTHFDFFFKIKKQMFSIYWVHLFSFAVLIFIGFHLQYFILCNLP